MQFPLVRCSSWSRSLFHSYLSICKPEVQESASCPWAPVASLRNDLYSCANRQSNSSHHEHGGGCGEIAVLTAQCMYPVMCFQEIKEAPEAGSSYVSYHASTSRAVWQQLLLWLAACLLASLLSVHRLQAQQQSRCLVEGSNRLWAISLSLSLCACPRETHPTLTVVSSEQNKHRPLQMLLLRVPPQIVCVLRFHGVAISELHLQRGLHLEAKKFRGSQGEPPPVECRGVLRGLLLWDR